jgi:hypothetical protein
MPGQEIGESGGRMIGDAAQHVRQPSLGIDVVHLGRHDKAIHERRPIAAAVGTGEQPCPSSEGNREVILPVSGRK